MKPILAILALLAVTAYSQNTPPLPPDVQSKPRGHVSITDAENAVVRAKQNAAKPAVVHLAQPKPQPAVQRVLDEVARQKLQPVKPAPMTPNPGRPVLRSPKTVLESTVNRRMKPKAESAPHEPGPRPNRTK